MLYSVPFAPLVIGLDKAQRNGQPKVLNACGAIIMCGPRPARFHAPRVTAPAHAIRMGMRLDKRMGYRSAFPADPQQVTAGCRGSPAGRPVSCPPPSAPPLMAATLGIIHLIHHPARPDDRRHVARRRAVRIVGDHHFIPAPRPTLPGLPRCESCPRNAPAPCCRSGPQPPDRPISGSAPCHRN